MYIAQTIAERIKQQAKKKNISINQLLLNCGLGKNTIAKMSNGTDILTQNFQKIAENLECSVDYLLGRTNIQEVNKFHLYRSYRTDTHIVMEELEIIKLTNQGIICLDHNKQEVEFLYEDIGKTVFVTENENINYLFHNLRKNNN